MSYKFPLPVTHNRIYGIANSQLTPEVMAELGAALGTLLGEGALVVTARDLYPPSRMLKRSFSAGLMSTGISVIDFHGATLPELAFAIKRFGAKAGVHFTVAPFREDSIQIKLLDSTGAEFSYERLSDLLMLYDTKHIVRTIPTRIGWVSYAEYIHEIYTASVTSYVDVNPIINASPRVAIDVNYGPASEVLPDLLAELGTEFIVLNSHKPPARRPTKQLPDKESLETLSEIVRASNSLLGVALSADASQVFIVDDNGTLLTPDQVASILTMLLPEESKVVISNSMSFIVDKVAEKNNIRLVRVKGYIGDISRTVRRVRATLGMADTGEFIFPSFSLSPDGIVTLAKLIEVLSIEELKLSTLVKEIPELPIYRVDVDVSKERMRTILEYLMTKYINIIFTPTHVKLQVDNTWVLIKQDVDREKIILEAEEVSSMKRETVRKLAEEIEEIKSTLIR